MEDFDGEDTADDYIDTAVMQISAQEHYSGLIQVTGNHGVVKITLSYSVLPEVLEDAFVDHCEVPIIIPNSM